MSPQSETPPVQRAALKIYLGYASHTGKTWRLLDEARRRKARGQDVVVGWIRSKDQPALVDLLTGLEVIPPRLVNGRPEMDLKAIKKRRPYVCIVDELAHANPKGARNAQRWQDVDDLLAAGIGVVTALNIQYVAGLQDRVRKLLGKAPEVSVPDEFVRGADEVSLVDASCESVLGRVPQKEPARFSERDLLSLRELALLFSAETVEEHVQEYRLEHHIETVWPTQERILVCLTANARGPHLIDRAATAAERWKGELWAIYVTPDEKWSNLSQEDASRVREFLGVARSRGARVEVIQDPDPAHGIVGFSRRHEITQIYLGHGAAYPFRGALSRTVAGRILLEATRIDVNVVADDRAAPQRVTVPSSPGLPLLARLLSGPPRPESRGHLRIYLGYAPGVGKTFQMLLDGRFLRDQGQEVAVGWCDTRGRQDLAQQLEDLEVVAPRADRVDVESLVARRPQVCLVDGLADEGRVQDVEALREAGLHVFTTLDVSEVESLKDTVERITGVAVGPTVPDWLLDEADEVVFVDVALRALLNRVKRGVVFPGTEEVPEERRSMFTEGSLSALRELAMRLVADRVEDDLAELNEEEGSGEAVLVCVHPRRGAGDAIRRAVRTADKIGAPCYAVYVAPDEDWTGVSPEDREIVRGHLDLARSLHVETHVLHGSDVARTIVDFAVRHGVTRIVMGRSRKTGWREFFQRSVIEQVVRLSPATDILVVADRQ